MDVAAPLVINEAGSCCTNYAVSGDLQNEQNWWDGICHASKDLGVGLTAYYWMSSSDMGPAYKGEEMITGDPWPAGAVSPTPNWIGKTFINYG